MRNSYLVTGIAALIVLVGGWYAFNKSSEDVAQVVVNSNQSMNDTKLTLTSPAFEANTSIPSTYTCDENGALSPALIFIGVPEGTKSFVLIMDDPDVPKSLKPDGVFDHWTLFNIRPETTGIPEGGTVGTAGANGAGRNSYTGPCPPAQYEPSEHRYFFKLYALDTMLDLTEGAKKKQVESAMEGHILEQTELVGKYKRK